MNYGKVCSKLLTRKGNKPTFLVGGGPSLKDFNFNRLKGKGYIVAINNAVTYIPFADFFFTEDSNFLTNKIDSVNNFKGESFIAVQPELVPESFKGTLLKRRRVDYFLSDENETITLGGNSGFGALNLAYLGGAKEIVLMGYDFKRGDDGSNHWHESYSWFNERNPSCYYHKWAAKIDETLPQLKKKDVSVFNTSKGSLLKAFPYKPIEHWVGK